MSWFPRPATPSQVEVLEPSGRWTPEWLFDLLSDPEARELREKVGVAGPLDGSAKSTTRLLSARGWILKTRTDQASASDQAAREGLTRARARGAGEGLWHPDKQWAVFRSGGEWYPLTACPELLTLRQLERWEDRALAWVRMIQASVDYHHAAGRGLDLNPSNFGIDHRSGALYYLDDEFCEGFSARNVAGAIAARIPEEPSAPGTAWRSLGASLERVLRDRDELDWEHVRAELALYPLPERFEQHRAELMSAGTSSQASRTIRARTAGELTCLIADVHSNLAALQAVLASAKTQGADSYLFLGDAVGYGPEPKACVQVLAELPRAVFVRGNHDHGIANGQLETGMHAVARESAEWTRAELGAAELGWLSSLPVEHVEDAWRAVHGAPKDPNKFLAYVYELTYEDNLRYLREANIPLCFYGHTHVQLTQAEFLARPVKLPGSRTFRLDSRFHYLVNPGSVGQPRDGDPRAAFALWNRRTGEIVTQRVEYDIERTLRALRATGLPSQLAHRLATGT